MTTDDIELVRAYAAQQSEQAFETLVARYVNLVYSTALRQVRDPHLAEEITQAVFIILAGKAAALNEGTVLTAWLYRTACYAATDALKMQRRRQRREQEAYMQSELQSTAPDPLWELISPHLDEALMRLGEKDRQAVVLHFFEKRTFVEVGNLLGTSEEGARKRAHRSLEKLRHYLSRRGLVATAAIIAGTISANSVHAAPVALAKSVTAVAIAKGAVASGSTLTLIKGALKLMAWTKTKTAIVAAAGVLLAAGTTTVAFNIIRRHIADDSWRVPFYSSKVLDQAAPQVKILPTKYSRYGGWGSSNDKVMGIAASSTNLAEAAYDFYQASRVVVSDMLPSERYDFIASLPKGAHKALQRALTKQLGVIARRETRVADVLRLTVKTPGAQGLRPSQAQNGLMNTGSDHYSCVDLSPSFLARFLEGHFGIPVVDHTDLKRHLDIDLKWDKDDPQNTSLKRALLDQLGLELVPGREPIEMLIVEKVQ